MNTLESMYQREINMKFGNESISIQIEDGDIFIAGKWDYIKVDEQDIPVLMSALNAAMAALRANTNQQSQYCTPALIAMLQPTTNWIK